MFSQESSDRIRSPERLNEYIRAVTPGTWILITALALVMAALIFWGMTGSIPVYLSAKGVGISGDVEQAIKMRQESMFSEADMVNAVRRLIGHGEHEVFVLSAVLPQKAEASVREKNDWLDRYLPEIDAAHRLFPLCGTNKADAVPDFCADDVLFDDHSPNLERWIQSGGRGVKILNEINGVSGSFRKGPRLRVKSLNDLLLTLAALAAM